MTTSKVSHLQPSGASLHLLKTLRSVTTLCSEETNTKKKKKKNPQQQQQKPVI